MSAKPQSVYPLPPGSPEIILVAARARNGVIGNKNKLPWSIPEDMKRFRKLTLGSTVLMGSLTYLSIGKPLDGRKNIVLSRAGKPIEGVTVFKNPASALVSIQADIIRHKAERTVYVIGGAQIYEAMLPFAHRMILTEIDRDYEGDAVFPITSSAGWTVSKETSILADGDAPAFKIVTYDRIA